MSWGKNPKREKKSKNQLTYSAGYKNWGGRRSVTELRTKKRPLGMWGWDGRRDENLKIRNTCILTRNLIKSRWSKCSIAMWSTCLSLSGEMVWTYCEGQSIPWCRGPRGSLWGRGGRSRGFSAPDRAPREQGLLLVQLTTLFCIYAHELCLLADYASFNSHEL